MLVRPAQPTSPGQRHLSQLKDPGITKSRPEKVLLKGILRRTGGRNYTGHITVRHHGGGAKRVLRQIDWKRDKLEISGRVMAIEYDPNRTANIALIFYPDGDKRYILAPVGLKVGDTIIASSQAEIKTGNTLPLKRIPVGTPIHNLELTPGKGGQLVRSAGAQAFIQAKTDSDSVAETGFASVLLPSKEVRLVKVHCRATIGQVSRPESRTIQFGKAGRRRWLGWRPAVRGVAMHPGAHPHGGGEGRSGIGMPSPKSPWGKPTLGKKTRPKNKYSAQYIVRHRRQP